MCEAEVSEELFEKWQLEVKNDFIAKNWMTVKENDINQDIQVDPRNIFSYLKIFESQSNAMYVSQVQTNSELQDTTKELTTVKKKTQRNKVACN